MSSTGGAGCNMQHPACNRLVMKSHALVIDWRHIMLLADLMCVKGWPGSLPPHLHRDSSHPPTSAPGARPCHICTGTGPTPAHICTGTGLTRPHLHRDLSSPLPHLHRDWGAPIRFTAAGMILGITRFGVAKMKESVRSREPSDAPARARTPARGRPASSQQADGRDGPRYYALARRRSSCSRRSSRPTTTSSTPPRTLAPTTSSACGRQLHPATMASVQRAARRMLQPARPAPARRQK